MTNRLMARAEAIARAAQRRRIEEIGATITSRGISVETTSDSIVLRGKRIAHRWLGDPVLRFAGRARS